MFRRRPPKTRVSNCSCLDQTLIFLRVKGPAKITLLSSLLGLWLSSQRVVPWSRSGGSLLWGSLREMRSVRAFALPQTPLGGWNSRWDAPSIRATKVPLYLVVSGRYISPTPYVHPASVKWDEQELSHLLWIPNSVSKRFGPKVWTIETIYPHTTYMRVSSWCIAVD